jgi:addiction module HigA family antidote
MAPAKHLGRLLRGEMEARKLSANRLALDLGVASGRITDILNSRRSITANTALRLVLYFGNSAQFWLDLQGQYDIAISECIQPMRREATESKLCVHRFIASPPFHSPQLHVLIP